MDDLFDVNEGFLYGVGVGYEMGLDENSIMEEAAFDGRDPDFEEEEVDFDEINQHKDLCTIMNGNNYQSLKGRSEDDLPYFESFVDNYIKCINTNDDFF